MDQLPTVESIFLQLLNDDTENVLFLYELCREVYGFGSFSNRWKPILNVEFCYLDAPLKSNKVNVNSNVKLF